MATASFGPAYIDEEGGFHFPDGVWNLVKPFAIELSTEDVDYLRTYYPNAKHSKCVHVVRRAMASRLSADSKCFCQETLSLLNEEENKCNNGGHHLDCMILMLSQRSKMPMMLDISHPNNKYCHKRVLSAMAEIHNDASHIFLEPTGTMFNVLFGAFAAADDSPYVGLLYFIMRLPMDYPFHAPTLFFLKDFPMHNLIDQRTGHVNISHISLATSIDKYLVCLYAALNNISPDYYVKTCMYTDC